jgi:hypothetical protein
MVLCSSVEIRGAVSPDCEPALFRRRRVGANAAERGVGPGGSVTGGGLAKICSTPRGFPQPSRSARAFVTDPVDDAILGVDLTQIDGLGPYDGETADAAWLQKAPAAVIAKDHTSRTEQETAELLDAHFTVCAAESFREVPHAPVAHLAVAAGQKL